MNELPPIPTEYKEGDLESFRRYVQLEMGDDEHAKRINFQELNDRDMVLYELYRHDILTPERIKQASNDARDSGERSSGLFRGWLASKMLGQMLKKALSAGNIK